MNILYSTHCPKCNVLEQKLKQKNIPYGVIDDVNIMIDKGFDFLPVFEVDSECMDFANAVKWINTQEDIDGDNT